MNNVKYESRNLYIKNNKQKLIRPFSIETIARSIKYSNMFNSLKDNNINKKIKKNKVKILSTKKLTRRIQDKLDEEMYSARKIQYRKYKLKKEPISNPLSFREINKNNNYYKNWNNEYVLPLILKNKIIHEIYKVRKEGQNDFLSTSGMINGKRLNDNKKNKLTISSLLIAIKNKDQKSLMNEDYKNLDNLNNRNKKINDYTEIKKNHNINKKITLKKKLTKSGLLTSLYHKYSSVNVNNKNKKNKEKVEIEEMSSNLSYDIIKEFSIINNNNSGPTFMTKLNDIKDNINISKIINRHNNLIWSIQKKNNKIIDKDNNIYINCLLSNVENEIKKDKIIYKNNGKTIYELDKDSSYKRLKKFENIINKFLCEKD